MSSNAEDKVNRNGSSTKQSLDASIYEFLQKSNLTNTANAFMQECGMEAPIAFNSGVPQGFLYEWWQIFWDLFNARAHHEGSPIAKQYYKILAEQQKREYAHRSVALQAARMQFMAEQNVEFKNELSNPAALSMNMNTGMNMGIIPTPLVNPNGNSNPMGNGSSISPMSAAPFAPQQNFVNNSGWPVYANQNFPVTTNTGVQAVNGGANFYATTPIATPPTLTKHKASTSSATTVPVVTKKTPSLKRRSSTNTSNVNMTSNEFKSPRVVNSTHSTPYDAYSGVATMAKVNNELIYNYQRQFTVLESETTSKKLSPSPLSMSATVANNSSNNTSATSKKNMLPPYAGVSPHTVAGSTPTANYNNSTQPKLKSSRRKSNSNVNVPASKSMQSSFSDVVYSQYSPVTPMTVNSTNDFGACGTGKPVLPSSLSTVTEVHSANSFVDSPDTSGTLTTKKSSKKVRKSKKSQQVFNSNQNGNFKFISSNSVPTPPNETHQKSQYRILNKKQSKKNNNSTSAAKSSKVVSKSSTEESPQLSLDDNSSTTPTFANAMWNVNSKIQTTPHANFTFIEDNPSSSGATNTLVNTENGLGSSSSGASNQFSETEADDLLAMKSILALHDSNESKNDRISGEETDDHRDHEHHHDSSNHTEFNLDLLEPSESSFNFLSWQN